MAAKGLSTECKPIKDYESVRKLMNASEKRAALLFTIGFMTGLRMNEIISLKWEDVLAIQKGQPVVKETARVMMSKQTGLSGRLVYRSIALVSELRDKILVYYRYNNQPPIGAYIFTERRRRMEPGFADTHISKSTVNRMLKKFLSLYQIDVKGNDSSTLMRKTFAWFYFKKNGLEMTQKALEHKNSLVTLRYIGVTEDSVLAGYANFYESAVEARTIAQMIEEGDLNLRQIVDTIRAKYAREQWRRRLADELKLYTSDEADIASVCQIAFLL